MTRLPQNLLWQQKNRGDKVGEIAISKNIDVFTNLGRTRLSPKLKLNTKDNDSGVTGLGLPVGFATHSFSGQKYIVACGIGSGLGTSGSGKILRSTTSDPTSAFINDALSNTPTDIHADFSDLVDWSDGDNSGANQGKSIFVSTYLTLGGSEIKKLYASTWDDDWFTSTVSGTFVTNGGVKNLCPAFNDRLYVTDDDKIIYIPQAGSAVLSGEGTIDFLGEYRPIWVRSGSDRIWIGLMKKDRDIGTQGFVGIWNGQGQALDKLIPLDSPCPLSCVIKKDTPYIVDAFGIWRKWDGTGFKEVGRFPIANDRSREMPGIFNDLTNNRWIHHRGMSVQNERVQAFISNIDVNGDPVLDMPAGLWELNEETGDVYHVKSPSFSANEHGQFTLESPGAIVAINRSVSGLLVGTKYFTDASTERFGIYYEQLADTEAKCGYIETTELEASEITQKWGTLFAKYKMSSADRIIIKKVIDKQDPEEIEVSWTGVNADGKTTFVTTTDLTGKEGYEIEVIQGLGGIAHITQVIVDGSNYYVDLDETFTGATGTAKVKIANWTKVKELSGGNFADAPVDEDSTKLFLKIVMYFTGAKELERVLLAESVSQEIQ